MHIYIYIYLSIAFICTVFAYAWVTGRARWWTSSGERCKHPMKSLQRKYCDTRHAVAFFVITPAPGSPSSGGRKALKTPREEARNGGHLHDGTSTSRWPRCCLAVIYGWAVMFWCTTQQNKMPLRVEQTTTGCPVMEGNVRRCVDPATCSLTSAFTPQLSTKNTS